MWKLKKKSYRLSYPQTRNIIIDVEKKLLASRGKRREVINWEIGVYIYTLL